MMLISMMAMMVFRLVTEVGQIQESIGLLSNKLREAQTAHQVVISVISIIVLIIIIISIVTIIVNIIYVRRCLD